MKYLAYTLSLIFILTFPVNGQEAPSQVQGQGTAVELTKKEKKQLEKETKKKEKELKKEQKKSKKTKSIKIGELPPETEEEVTNPLDIKIDINLGDLSSKKSDEKAKKHRGMSLAFGFIELATISDGLTFADKKWSQNRGGRALRSSAQSWDIFFSQYRLSKSPFWLRTGASISWNVLDFGDRSLISNDFYPGPEQGVTVRLVEDASVVYTRSSLTTSYIEAPLEFVFNSSKKGDKGVTIGIGGYVGLRLKTTRKINYTDLTGPVQDRKINRFYNNPVSYGLSTRLGYGSIYVKGRFALSKYFQQNLDIKVPYQLATLTLGIDL